MRDVLNSLETWREHGEEISVATVVNTWGSAPHPVGSKMIATGSGGIAGSVSAGCVEGAVIEEGKAVMKSGKPRLLSFGVSDEDAWEVGLACGGSIQVFVEPFSAYSGIYRSLKGHLEARDAMAIITVLDGPPEQLNRKLIVLPGGRVEGDLHIPDQSRQVIDRAQESLRQGMGSTFVPADNTSLFIEVYPPVSRLIVVGAAHFAEPLVSIANTLGFDTIVVDPRSAFATRERFPHATQLLAEWPQHALPHMALDESAHIVVLTHDPKLDDPALQIALQSGASYVGALGSRNTNIKRLERLRKAGLTEEQLARLHAPIGLPINGRSPAEIAVSIMAEIVQVKNQASVNQPSPI